MPDAQPYADVLVNTGKPSLSAVSDMPVIDLTKPGQGDTENIPVDNADNAHQDDGTSANQAEGEADGQPQGKQAGEGKDQTSPQVRAAISRAKNQAKSAEARAQRLESQLEQALAGIAKLTEKPAQEDPRPSRETFDNPDAFEQALEGWIERRATAKATEDAKAEQTRLEQTRQAQSMIDAFTERKEAFEAEHPDFADLVENDDLQISAPMSQAIMLAEDGPAIAYWLGQNPEAAERISKLSPALAVVEIGRISHRLANPPKPPAREPIRPLNTRNSAGPKDPSEMSMEEYVAYRAAKAH